MMDSVYSSGHYGSVIHSAITAPFQQYQMSSAPEMISRYPSSLHQTAAAVTGPPPPIPSFFGYNNNIDITLNNTDPIVTAVPAVDKFPVKEPNPNLAQKVHGELWPQPPPPPPPLLFSTTYNAPVQSTSGCYTPGDVAASTSYSLASSDASRMENYRTIIQPPPPPPFLFTSVSRKPAVDSITGEGVSSSKDNHFSIVSTDNNKELKKGTNKRSKFTGVICDLPENSRRPQVSEGRTFPLKVHGEYLRYETMKLAEELHHSRHYNGPAYQQGGNEFIDVDDEPVILTATKFVRKLPLSHSSTAIGVAVSESSGKGYSSAQLSPKSLDSKSGRSSAEVVVESVPGTSEDRSALNSAALKRTTSSGTLSRNGMSWRRRTSVDDMSEKVEKAHVVQKRKGNFRLRRIKDQVFTEDSNECFEFAEYGSCTSGVFCIYDHKGDDSHRKTKICARLLKGRCRKDNCKYSHLLQPHQMPLCDYYIRRICTKEECQFLHVKHTDSAKPCEQFNRGICKLGDDCSHPHRYYRAIIIKRGEDSMHVDGSNIETVSNDSDDDSDSNDGTDDDAVNANDRINGDSGILSWPV